MYDMGPFVVVAVAFLEYAFMMAPAKAFGPLFIQFQLDLNATAGQSSLVSAFMIGSIFLVGPLSSILASRLGYRMTILLGAMLSAIASTLCSLSQSIWLVQVAAAAIGAGIGLTSVPTLAFVGARFKQKRSLVNNIVTMGSNLLVVPLSPLLQFWIDSYGWRGGVLLLGGFYLNGLPGALLMTFRESKPEDIKLMNLSLLKSMSFCIFCFACGCEIAVTSCIQVFLVRFAQSRGVDDYLAASLISIIFLVDLPLRPISGYLTSLSHIGPIPIVRPYIYFGTTIVQALVVLGFTFTTDFSAIVAVTVGYAICAGCRGALSVTIMPDLFGTERLLSALGLRYLMVGVFSLAIPPLLGKIVDETGSYDAPFYASSGFSAASGILVLTVHIFVTRNNKHSITRTNAEDVCGNATQVQEAHLSDDSTT